MFNALIGGEVPRQQLVNVVDLVVGDAREHVPQIGFGIDAIEFRGADQAVDRSGSFTASILSREQVILPAQCDHTQRYYYVVTAVASGGVQSSNSNEVSATIPTP